MNSADGTAADPMRMVRTETAINTVATVVIAGAISWLLFRGQDSIPALAAPPGGIFGIVPGTFNFTLLVTLVLTLVIRGRLRAGRVRRLPPAGIVARLPRHAFARALVLAAATTLAFVPLTFALVRAGIGAGLLTNSWSFAGMLAFFCAYFAVVALAVTPLIVRRALAD
jgi:hypothetical protein